MPRNIDLHPSPFIILIFIILYLFSFAFFFWHLTYRTLYSVTICPAVFTFSQQSLPSRTPRGHSLSHFFSLSLSPSTPPSVSFISFLSLSPVPFLFLPLYHPLLSVSLCLFPSLCLCLYLLITVGGNNGKGEGWRGSSVNNSSNDLTTINQSSVSGVALTARTAIDRVLRYDKSVFLSVHSAIKKAGEQTQALDILK